MSESVFVPFLDISNEKVDFENKMLDMHQRAINIMLCTSIKIPDKIWQKVNKKRLINL